MANNPLRRFFPDISHNSISDSFRDFTQSICSSGDFSKNKNLNTILNSWRNILLTPRGSYDHDPTYGSDIHKLIMEPVDENTENRLQQEITNSLGHYDNRVMIKSMQIFKLKDMHGFAVKISAEYDGQSDEVTIALTSPTSVSV